ncbi:Conidiation-specific protein 6 [Trametes pubescens]|uniref:Conidiation-specific protein 6 n=1 Tax=Trametes pubescens TaxID=154538 RepID=A0A1M2V9G7_TRAPU|nr:Conidiation-specific protein 6 [Trametes pubescens]
MSSNRQIAGGHKAAINNPNVSEEAKEHSRQQLGGEYDDETEFTESRGSGGRKEASEGKDETRQNAGFKGVLKNPNAGEEAKEHAKQILEERGAM